MWYLDVNLDIYRARVLKKNVLIFTLPLDLIDLLKIGLSLKTYFFTFHSGLL